MSEHNGAWVVCGYEVGPYALAIYVSELDALRRINADGHGLVCFWPYGADLGESMLGVHLDPSDPA